MAAASPPAGPPQMKVSGEFWPKGTLAVGFAPEIPPIPPTLVVGVREDGLEFLWSFLGEEFLGAFAKEIQICLVHEAVVVDVIVVTVFVVAIFYSTATNIVGGFGVNRVWLFPPADGVA